MYNEFLIDLSKYLDIQYLGICVNILTSYLTQECGCSETGSEGPACDENGMCTCKDGYYGDKCMECSEAHVVNEDGSCSGGYKLIATITKIIIC